MCQLYYHYKKTWFSRRFNLIKVFVLIEGDVHLDLKLWREKHVLFFTNRYD